MGNLKARVAYLKGLAEGLKIDTGSQEGRMLTQVIEVLDQVADDLSQMEAATEDLNEFVQDIDEDLARVEDIIYADEEFLEVQCPRCGQAISFDMDLVRDEGIELTCPRCGEIVYECDDFEYDDDNDRLESGNLERSDQRSDQPQ